MPPPTQWGQITPSGLPHPLFPWRQGGSTQGSLETGGLVAPNGIGACRPATQALGAGTLRIGGAWGMSSH